MLILGFTLVAISTVDLVTVLVTRVTFEATVVTNSRVVIGVFG